MQNKCNLQLRMSKYKSKKKEEPDEKRDNDKPKKLNQSISEI